MWITKPKTLLSPAREHVIVNQPHFMDDNIYVLDLGHNCQQKVKEAIHITSANPVLNIQSVNQCHFMDDNICVLDQGYDSASARLRKPSTSPLPT